MHPSSGCRGPRRQEQPAGSLAWRLALASHGRGRALRRSLRYRWVWAIAASSWAIAARTGLGGAGSAPKPALRRAAPRFPRQGGEGSGGARRFGFLLGFWQPEGSPEGAGDGSTAPVLSRLPCAGGRPAPWPERCRVTQLWVSSGEP